MPAILRTRTSPQPPAPAARTTYPRFLDLLAPADRAHFMSKASEKWLPKGQILYQQGEDADGVFILLSGMVKVHYVHDTGASITASYYREGMLFGAHGCTPWAGGHVWSAQALVDCRALFMRRVDFQACAARSVDAMRCVLEVTEFKANQLRKVIRMLAAPTLQERVLMALDHLGSLYGIDRGGAVEIDGRFTHQELAEMIGASRQRVTTMLLALEGAGRIRRDKGRITLYKATPTRARR